MSDCRVCGRGIRGLDQSRTICRECCAIDYEKMYRTMRIENEQLKQELQQAKDMLRDCIVYDTAVVACEYDECIFCDCYRVKGHTDNCPYSEMTGGVE